MAKYAIDSTTLTGIADAIREKAGTSGTIQTSKMAESILAIKGGLSVDVVTASTLPDAVTDGQIVVITDTTPGTVYIDTDEPASPANGDVWLKLEAEATVKLEMTEESPFLRGGLKNVTQWDGSEWGYLAGYLGDAGTWKQFSDALPPIGTALNDCTWEQIAKIAAEGKASAYFSVGDAKEITINGTVGNTTFSNLSIWAFIIGFDHNSDVEGTNTIHVQIGKSAKTGGTNLCLVDSMHGSPSGSAGYFNVNYSGTNAGGWESSKMRTVLLGSNYTPTSPLANSLMAALPEDLRNVMKGVTKYSDNTGGGSNTASYVTATTDYLWLLAEYEVQGALTNANSTEKNYQEQYAYYASGNDKSFRKYNDTDTTSVWWTRSTNASRTSHFCAVNTNGNATAWHVQYSFGLAPCFCV